MQAVNCMTKCGTIVEKQSWTEFDTIFAPFHFYGLYKPGTSTLKYGAISTMELNCEKFHENFKFMMKMTTKRKIEWLNLTCNELKLWISDKVLKRILNWVMECINKER